MLPFEPRDNVFVLQVAHDGKIMVDSLLTRCIHRELVLHINRWQGSIAQQILQLLWAKVGNTKRTYAPFMVQLLHALPSCACGFR